MKKLLTVPDIAKTFIHPLVLTTIEPVFDYIGVSEDFNKEVEGFSITREPLSNRRLCKIVLEKTEYERMNNDIRSYRSMPIFYNRILEFRVDTVFSRHEYNLNITLQSTSRTEIGRIFYKYAELYSRQESVVCNGYGSYVINEWLLSLLDDMLTIRNKHIEEDLDYSQWINLLGTDSLSVANNIANKGETLIARVEQQGILLSLKRPEGKVEYDKETNLYTFNFVLNIEFRVPTYLNVTYSPFIFGEKLPDTYVGNDAYTDEYAKYKYYSKTVIDAYNVSKHVETKVLNGVITNGVFAGVELNTLVPLEEGYPSDDVEYNLTDFPDVIAKLNSLQFVDGYYEGTYGNFDLGFEFTGKLETLYDYQLVSDMGWTMTNGVVDNGPYEGYDTLTNITGPITDGLFINHCVFGGPLDGVIEKNEIGGIVLSTFEGQLIVGGRLSNVYISSSELVLPKPVTGTFTDGIVKSDLIDRPIKLNKTVLKNEIVSLLDGNYGHHKIGKSITLPTYDEFVPDELLNYTTLVTLMVTDGLPIVLDFNNLGIFDLSQDMKELINFNSDDVDIRLTNYHAIYVRVYSSVLGIIGADSLVYNSETKQLSLKDDVDTRGIIRVTIYLIKDPSFLYSKELQAKVYNLNNYLDIFSVGREAITMGGETTPAPFSTAGDLRYLSRTVYSFENKYFVRRLTNELNKL